MTKDDWLLVKLFVLFAVFVGSLYGVYHAHHYSTKHYYQQQLKGQ